MKPKGSKLKAKTLEHTEKDNPLNSLHNIPLQHSIHTLQGILSRNTHSSDLHATPIDFTAYCTVLCTLTCAHTCVLPCTWTCKCNCIRSYTPYMSASVCMDVFIHTLTHTDWHKFVYLPANKHTPILELCCCCLIDHICSHLYGMFYPVLAAGLNQPSLEAHGQSKICLLRGRTPWERCFSHVPLCVIKWMWNIVIFDWVTNVCVLHAVDQEQNLAGAKRVSSHCTSTFQPSAVSEKRFGADAATCIFDSAEVDAKQMCGTVTLLSSIRALETIAGRNLWDPNTMLWDPNTSKTPYIYMKKQYDTHVNVNHQNMKYWDIRW